MAQRSSEEAEKELLRAIKLRMPELEALRTRCEKEKEDCVYRFYHQSFKAYYLQDETESLVKTFRGLLPGRELNEWFMAIVRAGTSHKFDLSHNERWLEHTRPIVEAFLHAEYFLDMICRYGSQYEEVPQPMPAGFAAILYLYNMR